MKRAARITAAPLVPCSPLDHDRARDRAELNNLRVWPEWIEDGKQAFSGECFSCRSTLIVFVEVRS